MLIILVCLSSFLPLGLLSVNLLTVVVTPRLWYIRLHHPSWETSQEAVWQMIYTHDPYDNRWKRRASFTPKLIQLLFRHEPFFDKNCAGSVDSMKVQRKKMVIKERWGTHAKENKNLLSSWPSSLVKEANTMFMPKVFKEELKCQYSSI